MQRLLVCILLFSLFSVAQVPAQTPIIDSLRSILSRGGTSTARLEVLLQLCEERNSLSGDSLLSFAGRSADLAETLGLKREQILAGYFIACGLEKKGLFDSTLVLIRKQRAAAGDDPAYEDIRRRLTYLQGTTLLRKNAYEESLSVLLNLLREAEARGDTAHLIAAMGATGWAYMEMNQPGEAVTRCLNTLRLPVSPRYERYFIPVYTNISAVYGMLGIYDSVEHYVNIAIATARRYQTLTYLSNALNLKASLYMTTGRNPLAQPYLEEALEIRMKIGDPFYTVADLAQLTSYYTNAGQVDKALGLCLQGIAIAEANGITAKLPMLYDALARCYEVKGDLKHFSMAIRRHIAVKDSLYQSSLAEAIAELDTKYQLEKKENTIIRQNLQLVKRGYMLAGSGVLTVLLAGMAIYGFRRYRRGQRARVKRILEAQQATRAEAVRKAEESERKRIASDLHDNLGAYAASIAYNLEAVEAQAAAGNPALHELKANSQAMVAELSDTIWALKKEALRLTAISDRLKVFVQRLRSTYTHLNLDIEEHIETDILLPPSQAFHLLRMVQEALTNAVKHAQGSQVTVRISSAAGWEVQVQDNGRWQGPAEGGTSGNGLESMMQRAAVCGWDLRWLREDSGTTVIIRNTPN